MLNFLMGMMLGAVLAFIFIGSVTLMAEEDDRIESEHRLDPNRLKRDPAVQRQKYTQRPTYCGQEGACMICDCLFCDGRGETRKTEE